MGFSPDLTTTGAPIAAFTSPTYTLVTDLAPDVSSRQWAVSACGGTQTGARASSNGDPFTQTIKRGPYRALPPANPVNGSYGNVPRNVTEVITRKGVMIDSSGTIQVLEIRTTVRVPAGAESNDAVNIKAAVSAHEGLLYEESSDFADTLITGILG
nr:MAG: coat protein [Leviviridae sp.]